MTTKSPGKLEVPKHANWILLGFTLFLVLGTAELAVRILAKDPGARWAVYKDKATEWCCGPEIHSNPNGVHSFAANEVFSHCYTGETRSYLKNHCVQYQINNQGYRGPNFEIAKGPKTFRVVFLGDSFTFGEGVYDDDTYVARIGTALKDVTVNGKTVEVINLGMPGADTLEEAIQLKNFGAKLKPDYVVLQWNTNDHMIRGDSIFLDLTQNELRQQITQDTREFSTSALARFLYGRFRMKMLPDLVLSTNLTISKRGIFPNVPNIVAIRDIAAAQKAPLRVLVFPDLLPQTPYPYLPLIDKMKSIFSEMKVPYYDLTPDLQRSGEMSSLWVHAQDPHPNEIGHKIAAEHLAPLIARELQDMDSRAIASKSSK